MNSNYEQQKKHFQNRKHFSIKLIFLLSLESLYIILSRLLFVSSPIATTTHTQ